MSAFGNNLKQIRKDKGLRQSDLSAALGLSQTTIANYEQGIRFPDELILNQLADFLGVSTDLLLGRAKQARQLGSNGLAAVESSPENPELAFALDCLVGGRFQELQEWLQGQIGQGKTVVDLYLRIFQPALYEIGQRWADGRIDVYQEHALTEQIKRHIATVFGQPDQNVGGPRFLGFAVLGDMHELGIRMVCDILQLNGWNCLFLGVNVPPASILAAIRDFKPQVVGISASLEQYLPILQQTIYFIRNEMKDDCPAILAGGFAFNGKSGQLDNLCADGVALDGAQALAMAKALLSS